MSSFNRLKLLDKHLDSGYFKFLDIKPEIKAALQKNQPVVALESTIITHGMQYPMNAETALSVEKVVRDNGAIPATIAIIQGRIKVGLDKDEVDFLAREGHKVKKCSRRDIAEIIFQNKNGSTTVAATMIFAHMVGIKIFVTGGIGGVHRGVEETMDISADLIELGQTPVAVICAGVKSILDIPKTLEMLETLGVAVVGYKTNKFPEFFFSEGKSPVSLRLDSASDCANLIKSSFVDLGFKNGILVSVPVPKEQEASPDVVDKAINAALKEAREKGISGQEVTPFLLKRVNELSGGDSSRSNIALIKNNAAVGAQIAAQLSSLLNAKKTSLNSSQKNSDEQKVVVIGGSNLDLIGKSTNHYVSKTSNPGLAEILIGGVGRNIFECVQRLGLKSSEFITFIGDDAAGKLIRSDFETKKLPTEGIIESKGKLSGKFLALLDEKRDLVGAIANCDIVEQQRISNVEEYVESIKNANYVVLDANLQEEFIRDIILATQDSKNLHLIFEPVSLEKSLRILKIDGLHRFFLIKPNLHELYNMTNYIRKKNGKSELAYSENISNIRTAVLELVHKESNEPSNLRYIVISLGVEGVLLFELHWTGSLAFRDFLFKTERSTKVQNTNGAGDCLLGGIVWGLAKGYDIHLSVKAGMVCGKLAVESHENVSPKLSEDKVKKELKINH